jgi:hypothetical protein
VYDDKPPLTDAQVAALARPGESWEQARIRLEHGAVRAPIRIQSSLPRLRPEQLEMLWQHHQSQQGLSSRESFERHLQAQGRRWPTEDEIRAAAEVKLREPPHEPIEDQ